ncbi:kinase-like domain-containing protein, partial [Absidia repens]
MPFRSVTHQLKSKWQQKRSSRAKSVDLPTPPSTDNETAHPPTLQQLQQQQQQQQDQEQQNTGTTTKQDDKRKKGKDLPPSPDYLLAGIGDYLFDRPLGHGKFSKVMLAKHYLTGEQYAIKVIDKRLHEYRVMSRLVREIRLMEALDHPNVVHLYETVETADSLYLVMEYVPGFNLDEHLQKRHGLLHEDEARLIFRQMVAAVDYCHSRWVVHRDLKAPNVLLKTNGQVKLADFGLGNRFGLQRLRTMCGSMLYYSPEIICEQKYIGPEVDCWCLGVTLFRMTSGFEPFSHARTFGELRKDVIDGNYPMPTHFSEGLQQTIRKCLTVDRRRRIALRVALKDDPWLNDNGRMKDLFLEKGSDENVRHRMERERSKRQCLKDMEEEKQSGQHVKKTVIYHPINASIYFTGNAGYSPRMEENTQTQELLRAELLAEMK